MSIFSLFRTSRYPKLIKEKENKNLKTKFWKLLTYYYVKSAHKNYFIRVYKLYGFWLLTKC